jgi:NPCBM/NEW2 domain./Copper amine oxidase N-terminal domain.
MSKLKRIKDVTVGVVLGGVLFSGVSYAASTSIDVNFQPLKYFFDGVEKKAPADQQGFVYKGTTYVPLRFVSEALGKKVGYDGKTSSIYVGKQKEGTFTYMEQMKAYSNQSKIGERKIETFTSNTGDQYLHGYELPFFNGETGGSSDEETGWGFTKEYLLNGQYKTFQALLIPSKEWSTAPSQTDFSGSLEVFVDDVSVYKSGKIASNITEPIKVNVDLTGANKVKIAFKGDGTYHAATGGFGLVEAKFLY